VDDRTERRARVASWGWRAYALALTAVVALGAARQSESKPDKARFTEIDVERINVVEPDGKLRMVISNRPRSIGPIHQGKEFGYPGGSRPGVIFFNDEGSENGGLTFAGRRLPDGRFAASTGLSFDQFDQDQVLFLQYNDENGQRNVGMTVADRANVPLVGLVQERDSLLAIPDEKARAEALRKWAEPRDGQPLFARRVYVGRDTSQAALVDLSDPQGRTRLRLKVDAAGSPSLEFLDEAGRVTLRLPDGR
jgi:hypothetical protein